MFLERLQAEPTAQDGSLQSLHPASTETLQRPTRRSARPRKRVSSFDDASNFYAEASSVSVWSDSPRTSHLSLSLVKKITVCTVRPGRQGEVCLSICSQGCFIQSSECTARRDLCSEQPFKVGLHCRTPRTPPGRKWDVQSYISGSLPQKAFATAIVPCPKTPSYQYQCQSVWSQEPSAIA